MANQNTLQQLSNELSGIIDHVSESIVLVQGRRFPSSGVVWEKNIVVAADHSLPRNNDVHIQTSTGDTLAGVVAGRDPATDIAIIKVAVDLNPIDHSNAAPLKTGQLAVVVGRANGGRPLSVLTMISGTSGTYKNWRGGTFDQFIRLDLSSFPGFSGSALILPDGKTAGINTSVFSRHFGLTIPASNIDRLVERINNKGSIGKPYLGLMMHPVRLPEKFKEKAGTEIGLILLGTENGSPAEQAGLFVGDILVRCNGKTLNSIEEIHDSLTAESIGSIIQLQILRGGALEEVQVTVGERPSRQKNG